MTDAVADYAAHIAAALRASPRETVPFRHWRLKAVLPEEPLNAINAQQLVPPAWEGADGRRAWNNDRVFVDRAMQEDVPETATLAEALQSEVVLSAIEDVCELDLTGLYLRIEYCMDSRGFWLEPHTDLGVKRLTLQVYCARDAGASGWGTSIYGADKRWVGNMDASFDNALMFVPGSDTWHGFEPREISGVRRSLIINFVTPEWQSRQELAFPGRPVLPRSQRH
jgi:hypothetical protein